MKNVNSLFCQCLLEGLFVFSKHDIKKAFDTIHIVIVIRKFVHSLRTHVIGK